MILLRETDHPTRDGRRQLRRSPMTVTANAAAACAAAYRPFAIGRILAGQTREVRLLLWMALQELN